MNGLLNPDGARGLAFSEFSCESAMNYGRALCFFLSERLKRKPEIIIGTDTRASSELLDSCVAAGVCSAGGNAVRLGVIPTPAASYLVRKYKADAGIVLCAGEATAAYNGIRLFSSSGFYLPKESLEEISELSTTAQSRASTLPLDSIGSFRTETKALWDYIRQVISSVKTDLRGVKIAIDCANGSASLTAKNIFEGLGASCAVINASPDGMNINNGCGVCSLEPLRKYVTEKRFGLGVAFDGNAERIAVVDENGTTVDADRLLAVLGCEYHRQGILADDTVVASMMTNLGVTSYASANGFKVVSVKPGIKYISEKMLDGSFSLGGTPEGKILFGTNMPVSDAQVTGLRLLEVLVQSGKKLSELAGEIERFPQVLLNIKINPQCSEIWKNDAKLSDFIAYCEERLGSDARVLVRESGKEPVIRVLVEGRNFDDVNKYALMIADKIKERVKPANSRSKGTVK